MNSFKKYLVAIVPNIVYKSVKEAELHETQDTRLAGDQYIEAKLQTGDFDSIRNGTISIEVLHQLGIYDMDVITAINEDKFMIPESLRQRVWELHCKQTIASYEEKNNYYRKLNGLPNLNQNNIYLDPSELNHFGYFEDKQEDYDNDNFDKLTPLHKLPENILILMESNGYLDEIYDEYSKIEGFDVEFIKYLGVKRIDPVVARMAGQYELLYVPRVENANRFTRDFITYYEEARQYFLNQVFNYHFNSEYEFYESYIGFFILIMGIQRTINSLFEVVVQRDFYDIETCRTFLEAYGVPFIKLFTFNQQLNLVKNLNILLMGKCTIKVLYDILMLLNYNNYALTKYLLVKQHKTELNKNMDAVPVFIYKSILSENGSPMYELDESEMYDYYFIAMDIDDNDTTLVEESDSSAHGYREITGDDAYWIEDKELVDKLNSDSFNFTESKYASLRVTIKLYEVLFETAYLLKMICDKKNETSKIVVDLPLITYHNVTLLDMIILLICLLCKYNKMSPDLIRDPSKELSVLGFDFDEDLEAIKQDIIDNPDIYSQDLIKFMKNITFNTVSDVNDMYGNVKELASLLNEGMENTKNVKVYYAYKKLYNTLFITKTHNELFILNDGTMPTTYMDWLKENNYDLYKFIVNVEEDEIVDKINYITTKMITWFTNCQYLEFLNPVDSSITSGIIKILRWFKSYTIDIKGSDVVYIFSDKAHNLMKLLDAIWLKASTIVREIDMGYDDWVNNIFVKMLKREKEEFINVMKPIAYMTPKELNMVADDIIKGMTSKGITLDKMSSIYSDIVCDSIFKTLIKDTMNMHDSIRIQIKE